MYTKLLKGQIIFYYPHAGMFEDVQHMSAFMCKNITSKDGADLMENYAITDDERPMFYLCLRETLPSVYDAIKVLTHGIEDAFYDKITGTEIKALDASLAGLEVADDADYVILRTVDHGAYNPNDVKLVDSSLLTGIEQGVLAEFYVRVTHPELTKLSADIFAGQVSDITHKIVPLRKKTVL